MKKSGAVIKALCLLTVCLLPVGCRDGVELENRGFVISLGIDAFAAADYGQGETETGSSPPPVFFEGGGEPRFTLTMALPNVAAISENKSGGEAKSVKKTAENSISAAMALGGSFSSQKLYFGQTKICVLGRGLLEDPVLFKEALDTLERGRDINRRMIMISCEGKAEDILNAEITGEPLVGLFIARYYDNSPPITAFRQTLEACVSESLDCGCTLIPRAERVENGLKLSGAAVIKDFCLAGFIDDSAARAFKLLRGEAADGQISLDFDGAAVSFDISREKAAYDFYEADGEPRLEITLRAEGSLSGRFPENRTYFGEDKLEELRLALENKIQSEAEGFILLAQETYGADLLGVADKMRKYRNDMFKKYSNGENGGVFQMLGIHVSAAVKINDAGRRGDE
jgi:Ger(x)C family germination protein